MKKKMFDDSIFDKKIIDAARSFKPLVEILNEGRHRYLCNRWISRLLDKKYGGEK